ncbi:VOC family protein [Bradyrhizobium japonicum]|nr:VOC family protein [Bradyrhizobium japonicum]
MSRRRLRPIWGAVIAPLLCLFAQGAEAELGPCMTAAPTTPNVVVFVSDIDKSIRWYRSNIGLAVEENWNAAARLDSQVVVMGRNGIGVTLLASGRPVKLPDPQRVCFVFEGPPAPSSGSPPLFLTDPDGTSVELPSFPASRVN